MMKKEKKITIFFKLKSLLKDLVFFPDTLFEAKRNVNKLEMGKEYDYIISSSDSKISHYMALEIISKKKIKYKKWIQIWGDPWAEDLHLRKKPFFLRKRILFRRCHRSASGTITFLFPGIPGRSGGTSNRISAGRGLPPEALQDGNGKIQRDPP